MGFCRFQLPPRRLITVIKSSKYDNGWKRGCKTSWGSAAKPSGSRKEGPAGWVWECDSELCWTRPSESFALSWLLHVLHFGTDTCVVCLSHCVRGFSGNNGIFSTTDKYLVSALHYKRLCPSNPIPYLHNITPIIWHNDRGVRWGLYY